MNSFWETTLVDWVNCLKLHKPILKLDDLRDGVFFTELQKVIKIPEGTNTDILTCIFHIFEKHYPKLTIHEKMNVHLTDLKSDELNILTSMLMHYTCIHDRQDVLTSPLCHSLKPQTQKCIKFFLEKIQECHSLTDNDLMKIIQQCTAKIMEPPSSNFIASSGEDSKESPLYGLLKTPMSKRIKIFEKDKEISQLKATLEVAQEEKDDLEEDLRKHIERNKKLEKQLDQRNVELSRLKSEIVALENRTPPHFRDIDTVETERILKTQIDSLEKIIERCNIENEELQDERDAERARAKLFESQCKAWMEKFLDTEKKLMTHTEHSEEQESKLDNLKKHCEELEALLQEYKPKNGNQEESFVEESFQLAPTRKRRSATYCTSNEDLAHSVVDLQLKEKEKENEEIRSALDSTVRKMEDSLKEILDCRKEIEDLTTENGSLKDQLHELMTEYNMTIDKMKNVTIENDKFRCDIENVGKVNENLKGQVEQLTIKYAELTNDKEVVLRKLEEYTQICDGTQKKLDEVTKENTACRNQIETLTIKSGKFKDQVVELLAENTDINNRIETMERELEAYVQTCRILEDNLANLKAEKEQLSEEKVQILQDLVDSVTQLKLINIELENATKSKELVEIELQNALCKCGDLERNILIISIQKTKLYEELQEAISVKEDLKNDLQSIIEAKNKEFDEFSQKLKDTEKHCSDLKEQKGVLEKELQVYIDSCNNLVKQVEGLKDEKQQLLKDSKAHLQEIKSLESMAQLNKEQTENIARKKNELEEKLRETESEKSDLLTSYEAVTTEKEGITNKLMYASNKIQEISDKLGLTSNVQTNVQNIAELYCQNIFESLGAISSKLDVMLKERDVFDVVDKLSEEKEDLVQTLEITMSDLRKTLSEKTNLAESLDKVTKELEKLSVEKHKLCEELEMQRRELAKVKKERNNILETQAAVLKETESNIRLAHESAVDIKNDLSRRIELLEKEKQNVKKHLEADLQKIREAYSKVVSTNSKLELETVNLRRKIEEKNEQLTDYTQIKDAYEKLLEENNKLMTEVDTLKYKRSRDREEFVNIVKKERADAVAQENRKVREIKNEYEKKLEKMKERMLNLYKEEVNKEMQKVKDGHDESTFLQRTVEDLRQSLTEAEERVQLLETELEMFKIKEAQMQKVTFFSRDSIRSAKDLQLDSMRPSGSVQSLGRESRVMPAPNSTQMSRKVKSVSTMQSVSDRGTRCIQERKITTLPRSRVDIEETVTVSRRTSIGVERVAQNLEMEDEEDDFNNKYLAELKAGQCVITHGRGSNAIRLSELAWRNSLVPPHLKSSYPAETQFISPGHFKEDDIKTGNIELDDSLCKLLPGEKPRQKKDFGTTSYKKPGPPTPSKNGGRLSLQGNEVQPLRDHNERTPKKVTTPSRIKALFMGKTISKENSDSQNVTPGTSKRLSIFRKQKQ